MNLVRGGLKEEHAAILTMRKLSDGIDEFIHKLTEDKGKK